MQVQHVLILLPFSSWVALHRIGSRARASCAHFVDGLSLASLCRVGECTSLAQLPLDERIIQDHHSGALIERLPRIRGASDLDTPAPFAIPSAQAMLYSKTADGSESGIVHTMAYAASESKVYRVLTLTRS